MVKRWVLQIDDCRYLICGKPETGYKFGELKDAFHFTNRAFVASKCEELQAQGYNAVVSPVKKTNYALTA